MKVIDSLFSFVATKITTIQEAIEPYIPYNGGAPDNQVTSLPSGTQTQIGTMTFEKGGTYLIDVFVRFSGNATGYRKIELLKNDTGIGYWGNDTRAAVNGDLTTCRIVVIHNFAAGDIANIKATQNSGSTLTIAPRVGAFRLIDINQGGNT